MGGAAPAVDARGDVWVSVGNGSVYQASRGYDDSDSVLDLSPSMRLLQYFAPADWPANNSRDLDMSAEPVLLPGGQVLLAGKSPTAYLLNGAHLGGIGSQLASLSLGVRWRHRRRGRGGWPHRVPALCQRDRGRRRDDVTAGPPAAVAVRDRRRAAHRGRWAGLDDQPGRVALWPRSADRARPAEGAPQWPLWRPDEPLPDPQRRAGLLLAPAGNRVVAFRVGPSSSPAGSAAASSAPWLRPLWAHLPGVPAGRRRTHHGPVRRRHRGHRGRQPAGAGRDRLAGVAPHAEPALGGPPSPGRPAV